MPNDDLKEIVRLASGAGTAPTATALPRVVLIKGEVPEHQLAAIYQPMIGFLVQGGKTLAIGGQAIALQAPSYFVIPTELPATGRVHQGARGLPYLSVGLYLDMNTLMALLADVPTATAPPPERSFTACAATPEFIGAWRRMLQLLEQPQDIPALYPVYEREILYRVLSGPQGWRLREQCATDGKVQRLRKAIQWMRTHYTASIDIAGVAARAGMALTTFHREFKGQTGMSPIQFQKQLRLLEARKLMVYGDCAAADAAYKVGYESASQFSREYARFFGAPPARDASILRQLGR